MKEKFMDLLRRIKKFFILSGKDVGVQRYSEAEIAEIMARPNDPEKDAEFNQAVMPFAKKVSLIRQGERNKELKFEIPIEEWEKINRNFDEYIDLVSKLKCKLEKGIELEKAILYNNGLCNICNLIVEYAVTCSNCTFVFCLSCYLTKSIVLRNFDPSDDNHDVMYFKCPQCGEILENIKFEEKAQN